MSVRDIGKTAPPNALVRWVVWEG